MGSSLSKYQPAKDPYQDVINQRIDAWLQKEKIILSNERKILLLGTQEAGKSTILKQLRILHSDGFNNAEILNQKYVIHYNLLSSMSCIVLAMPSLNIGFHNSSSEVYAAFIVECAKQKTDVEFTEEVQHSLKALWNDRGVQEALTRANEYHLIDSVRYFFGELERVGKEDFVPTVKDILMARVQTTGLVEFDFKLRFLNFRVIDVGGQRSERKKWIHCFDNVSSIIFVASLSEYDQKLREDESMNRMGESMRLFGAVANNDIFLRTSIMLFLNKKDIFEEKLKTVPLTVLFPEYEGGHDYPTSVSFLRQKFGALRQKEAGKLYTHETCATDTDQMKFVLDVSFDQLMKDNAAALGIN